MADLFARLGARALGAAPALTPRLPARFEGGEADPIEVDDWVRVEPEHPVPPSAEPHVAGPHSAEPLSAEAPSEAPLSTVSPLAMAPRPPRPVRAAGPVGTAAPDSADVREAVPLAGRGDRWLPAGAPIPATLAPPPAPEAVAPSTVERHVGAARPAPARRGESREPVVRISIGRIEVRAAAPAVSVVEPASAPAAAEPAGLGLAAYLRGERQ